MQRLKLLWESAASRQAMRWLVGIRIIHPDAWDPPDHPHELATRVEVPLLVVHGHDDAYFPLDDAHEIVAAAPDAVLWDEPSFGHAEDGLTPAFCRRLAAGLATALCDGQFPAAEVSA